MPIIISRVDSALEESNNWLREAAGLLNAELIPKALPDVFMCETFIIDSQKRNESY